jgi:hypothetical protein
MKHTLKTALAARVNDALTGLAFAEGEEAPVAFSTESTDFGITSVEVHKAAPLETVIRVRTGGSGVRYYSVRTSELP